MRFDIGPHERAILVVNGEPSQYLGPGRHRIFRPLSLVEVVRLGPDKLTVQLEDAQLRLVPAQDLRRVVVAEGQRALVSVRGRPALWLGPGRHQVLTVDRTVAPGGAALPAVEVELFDVSGVYARPLRDEVKALVPATEYVEATAPKGSVVLRYVDGELDAVLPAGRHAAWTVARKVHLEVVDVSGAVAAYHRAGARTGAVA
jgi:hypothetical protein